MASKRPEARPGPKDGSLPGVLGLIGSTPVVRLERLTAPTDAEVWLKLEGNNPGGSVKDRIALSMISDALARGLLRPGMTVVEPTSGNTGIGIAMVCAALGYECLLVMPESMSLERRSLLAAYGAKLDLTPAAGGMTAAVDRARQLAAAVPGACFLPMQFDNPANPAAHQRTAREILVAPGLPLDAFVAGVGTGGTATGCAQVLREAAPEIRVVAVEPAGSPVLSGGKAGPHKIQGIGAGFVPGVLDRSLLDEVFTVEDEEAGSTCRALAAREGLFLGISSGAAVAAALRVARQMGPGRRVLAIAPDRGDRYLSAGLWGPVK